MKKPFNFADYLEQIDFENSSDDPALPSFYRFLCTMGNKETEFTTMFASELDRYLASEYPSYWLLGNRKIPHSLRLGHAFEVTKAKSGIDDPMDKEWDLLLFEHQGQGELRVVVEFKTNRHNAFLDEVEFETKKRETFLANRQEIVWASVEKRKFWKGVLFDIEMLHELRRRMPGVEIWHGTLLYSLYSPKALERPEIVGQYLGDEPKSRDTALVIDGIASEAKFHAMCDDDTKLFMRILSSELQSMGLLDSENRGEGHWVHKKVAAGKHRGIYVRSDLVLLKVSD